MSDTKVKSQSKKEQKEETVKKPVKKVAPKTPKKVVLEKKSSVEQTITVDTKSSKEKDTKKLNGLSVDVLDTSGKVVDSVALPKEVFGMKDNPMLLAQAIRVFLANQRRGSASTKTRGEVEGSTRKIYRQKGTGRARHGAVRAPIFVHGGIAFGPRPRDFSLSLPKKMRRAALFCALSLQLRENNVKVVTGLDKVSPKTKEMAKVFKQLALEGKKQKVMLVIPENVATVQRAAQNMAGVRVIMAKQLNTYEVMTHKTILFMQDAIEAVEKNFIKEA